MCVDNRDKAIPRLYLTDRHSGTLFLVNCGATVRILLVSLQNQKIQTQTTLLIAANGSHIATYSTQKICLDLVLRQTSWSFRLATVTKPILCLNFLSTKHLAVDFQWCTVHAILPHAGRAAGQATHNNCAVLHVNTHDHDQWSFILFEFPSIIAPNSCSPINKHSVFHYIPTAGPPPNMHAQYLPPDQLTDINNAFEDMVAEGICQRSSSPYASLFHNVRKPDVSWRLCDDY